MLFAVGKKQEDLDVVSRVMKENDAKELSNLT